MSERLELEIVYPAGEGNPRRVSEREKRMWVEEHLKTTLGELVSARMAVNVLTVLVALQTVVILYMVWG